MAALQAAVNKRKQLYEKMDNFNNWTDEMKDKVEGTEMIFADEVADNQGKLKVCFDIISPEMRYIKYGTYHRLYADQ